MRYAEVPEQVLEVVDEEVDRPEAVRLLRQERRAAAADLVVEHDGYRCIGREVRKGEKVVVHEAGPAVQADERRARAILQIAEDLVPGLERFALVRGRVGAADVGCFELPSILVLAASDQRDNGIDQDRVAKHARRICHRLERLSLNQSNAVIVTYLLKSNHYVSLNKPTSTPPERTSPRICGTSATRRFEVSTGRGFL